MQLKKLEYDFSVCKLADGNSVNLADEFVFVSKTDDEISLVCKTSSVPTVALAAEHGWKALKISGLLEFGLVGIIAKIAGLLARASVSVFVISTFNTDYILIKAADFERAARILAENDYSIV